MDLIGELASAIGRIVINDEQVHLGRGAQNIGNQLLDQLIVIVTSSMLMAYSLYTFQGETGNHRLMVTIPFVLYGVFRYLYLIYVQGEGGSPEEVLLRDPHIRASVVLCALAVGLVLYVVPG